MTFSSLLCCSAQFNIDAEILIGDIIPASESRYRMRGLRNIPHLEVSVLFDNAFSQTNDFLYLECAESKVFHTDLRLMDKKRLFKL